MLASRFDTSRHQKVSLTIVSRCDKTRLYGPRIRLIQVGPPSAKWVKFGKKILKWFCVLVSGCIFCSVINSAFTSRKVQLRPLLPLFFCLSQNRVFVLPIHFHRIIYSPWSSSLKVGSRHLWLLSKIRVSKKQGNKIKVRINSLKLWIFWQRKMKLH